MDEEYASHLFVECSFAQSANKVKSNKQATIWGTGEECQEDLRVRKAMRMKYHSLN